MQTCLVFDTKDTEQEFSFEDDKSTAKFIKEEDTSKHYNVKVNSNSSSSFMIHTKFKFTKGGYFGIINDSYVQGFPGFAENGWSWSTDGKRAYHGSKDNNYQKHTLGHIAGKKVDMKYDGCNKTL